MPNVNGDSGVVWESLPVEYKSAALLDKESLEMRRLLEAQHQRTETDFAAYLNNDPNTAPSTTPSKSSWLSRLTFIQSLGASDVTALAEKIATRKYFKGESILNYAEQKRAVFYVESGDVGLLGPESSTGSNIVGALGQDAFFNEMGLFSRWSRQPALFKAESEVICQVLELETLLTVLGESKVAPIRDDYLRKRHKALSLSEDKKVHYADSTHAQVFRVKVPVPVVDGSGSHANGLSHRWTLGIYNCLEGANAGAYTRKELLGSAYLLPSQIGKHGEADLTVPIFSAGMSIVGQLTLSYLVLTPFTHPKNNIANVDGYRLALTRENTLASFILAGRSGADFVEFDVQLTKDRVPVIYHDFLVNVGLEDKSAGSLGTKPETYEIGIHDMSFRQLTQSYTTPVPHKGGKSQQLQNRVKKHWARLQGNKQVPSPKHEPLARSDDSASEEGHLVDFFPRLEDLLKHVPAEVGLNIEVKYPDNFFRAAMRNLSCFAINAYIDQVLQCVFDYAGSRRIFFSRNGRTDDTAIRHEPRQMENLQGIVSNSNAFLETPELAPLVKKDMGSVLITWGDQNTNHEMVQLQKRHAVDGVISDNVIDLINQDKKLQALAK
ncbi:Glycerophosphocholine phosphodiesterase GDE1 [Phytophthora ramorum]|uniref:Glycerophosphocholine phosphodiesterase GDE1 n=1 Tax=Phytophthora ramorum TaxID=164328 RepID=UPI0030AB5800|nr:Glycerophosphocholine phosphodiesterase GDE1 [Phytophthora ramorum]